MKSKPFKASARISGTYKQKQEFVMCRKGVLHLDFFLALPEAYTGILFGPVEGLYGDLFRWSKQDPYLR